MIDHFYAQTVFENEQQNLWHIVNKYIVQYRVFVKVVL